jgi:hypothetical protein
MTLVVACFSVALPLALLILTLRIRPPARTPRHRT